MEVTTIILAGGKSLRLGRNKSIETFCGKSMVDCVLGRLTPLSKQTLIVTSQENTDLPVTDDIEIITDIYPQKGPLGGIYTGLVSSKYPLSIVVACDMPFLNGDLFRRMIELSGEYDAVVPRMADGGLQPLHSVFSVRSADKLKEQLGQNQLRMETVVKSLNVKYIEEPECRKYDPELLSFYNINYQKDLERALLLVAQGKC